MSDEEYWNFRRRRTDYYHELLEQHYRGEEVDREKLIDITLQECGTLQENHWRHLGILRRRRRGSHLFLYDDGEEHTNRDRYTFPLNESPTKFSAQNPETSGPVQLAWNFRVSNAQGAYLVAQHSAISGGGKKRIAAFRPLKPREVKEDEQTALVLDDFADLTTAIPLGLSTALYSEEEKPIENHNGPHKRAYAPNRGPETGRKPLWWVEIIPLLNKSPSLSYDHVICVFPRVNAETQPLSLVSLNYAIPFTDTKNNQNILRISAPDQVLRF
jgi:hypothetical protein